MMGRVLFLATALLAGCERWILPPDPGADRLALFDEVWTEFDRHYALFELGGFDWGALGATYRDSVLAAQDDREAARLIGAMIGRLGDYHSSLTTPYGSFGPPAIRFPRHFDATVVHSSYVPDLRWTGAAHVGYGWLPGDPRLGYVYLPSFAGGTWGDEIDEALGFLDGATGLVVDIRGNGGGSEANGRIIAARLVDRVRPYKVTHYRDGPGHGDFAPASTVEIGPAGARSFRGPVVLLTNRYNGSAAEDFTLMMRVIPTVTVMGDTTLGVGTNPLPRELPNGWTYRVSQSYQATPDGFVYQWKGLPPAAPVPWPEGARGDPYLDAAIRRLRGS